MSRREIYRFIAAEKTSFPVRTMCRVLEVSASAFYAWHACGDVPSVQEQRDAQRLPIIQEAWEEHRKVYGSRRLTAEVRDRGHVMNRKAVARLMRLAGIEGAHRRRKGKGGRRRRPDVAPAPDLVDRNFTVDGPDQLWVADISYLRTWEGFLYLAVVIDAFSRKVVGWAMADHLRTELVLDAFGMALFTRKPAAGLVHHSDRGTQYTSFDFGRTLRASGVLASMGSVADAYDNAMAETFFATLKTELIYTRSWSTRHELESEVFSYIEGFYNPKRRHSRLGNLSPATFEQQHHQTTDTQVSA